VQIEKGYAPENLICFIDGMSVGKDLYKFDYEAFYEAENEFKETGIIPHIGFQGDE
jgi:hypothetical protein